MLRPFFLRLRDPVELDRLRERFLEVMKSRFSEDHSLKVKVTSWHGGITPDVRVKFRVGLSTNLFGSDDLLSLRMRLSLVDVCWVFSFFFFGWMVPLDLFFFFFLFVLLEIDKQRETTDGMRYYRSRPSQRNLSPSLTHDHSTFCVCRQDTNM